MWQRFTERARKVIFYAQEEAGRLGHTRVGPEHLLLGLVRESDSVAERILHRLGLSLHKIRHELERQMPKAVTAPSKDFQLTPGAKRVIDLAYDEARQLLNNYIGTEHLLLGVIREGNGLGSKVLVALGADLTRTRLELQQLQASGQPHEPDVTIPTRKLPVHRSADTSHVKGITDLLAELVAGQKRLEEKIEALFIKGARRHKDEEGENN